jgi:hypothetical protein
MSNGTHPLITNITVTYNDGTEVQKTYPDASGYMPVALFWSDDVVANILGEYYNRLTTPHQETYESLEKHFGPIRAKAVCPGGAGTSVAITKDIVTTIWNMPNQTHMLVLMSKDPSCDIGG